MKIPSSLGSGTLFSDHFIDPLKAHLSLFLTSAISDRRGGAGISLGSGTPHSFSLPILLHLPPSPSLLFCPQCFCSVCCSFFPLHSRKNAWTLQGKLGFPTSLEMNVLLDSIMRKMRISSFISFGYNSILSTCNSNS